MRPLQARAAVDAARDAINSPLLEDTKIWGARQVLMNITASREIGLHEMSEACSLIREACGSGDTHVSFGVIEKPGMGEEVRVTVIATGFPTRRRLSANRQSKRCRRKISSSRANRATRCRLAQCVRRTGASDRRAGTRARHGDAGTRPGPYLRR